MVWPRPSLSPSRPMLTPDAAPVTTTWNDSNSFCAAAIFAVAGAFAAACSAGRIFWDAVATQTCAAEADAVTNKVANRGSVFTAVSPWLAASRSDECCRFRQPNGGGQPSLPWPVCRSVPKPERLSGGRGVARTLPYRRVQRRFSADTSRVRAHASLERVALPYTVSGP